jgi:hypothetical protein
VSSLLGSVIVWMTFFATDVFLRMVCVFTHVFCVLFSLCFYFYKVGLCILNVCAEYSHSFVAKSG